MDALNEIEGIVERIVRSLKEDESPKRALLGFDGFVDSIFRVIRRAGQDRDEPIYFGRIGEFGTYLNTRDGKSCSFEIVKQQVKFGGNAPIMADALGRLGVEAHCVGALGAGRPEEAFRQMSGNCVLYPVCWPGLTTALEFGDGKVMLCDNKEIQGLCWEDILRTVPQAQLTDFFARSDLVGLLNWSELAETGKIWQQVIEEILPALPPKEETGLLFFDLSDCSKRCKEEIRGVLKQMAAFSKHYRVYLSLNENELDRLYQVAMGGKREGEGLSVMARKVFGALSIQGLVIHTVKQSLFVDCQEEWALENIYIQDPLLSTGGGDNFNAGFCYGLLLGLSPRETLMTACATGSFYVEMGRSPEAAELADYLRRHQGHAF